MKEKNEWNERKYQEKLLKQKICSICYSKYKEFGNNAEPINMGTCCDSCNRLVIIARVNSMIPKNKLKR